MKTAGANYRVRKWAKDLALGIGYLIAILVVPLAVMYGVFGWLVLIYGAGITASLAIYVLDRRRRFFPDRPALREGLPWLAGATVVVALLVLLHQFIHPQWSWSNLEFLFGD